MHTRVGSDKSLFSVPVCVILVSLIPSPICLPFREDNHLSDILMQPNRDQQNQISFKSMKLIELIIQFLGHCLRLKLALKLMRKAFIFIYEKLLDKYTRAYFSTSRAVVYNSYSSALVKYQFRFKM